MKPEPERLRSLRELPPPTSKKSLQRAMSLFAYYAKRIPRFSDKIARLKAVSTFPLDGGCLKDFQWFKECIENTALHAIDETRPFLVECDASDVAI